MRRSNLQTELAKMRVASGMLQKELADRLGIKQTHLQKIEAGIRKSNRVEREAIGILNAVVHS
jgi:transcriptional regulator with XRE-family HTH domain